MRTGRKYEPVKETRGWYYVEYYPPSSDNKYAWLNLVITEARPKEEIVVALEKETELWLNRYPVPIFANAWDDKEDRYDLSEIKSQSHLIGFFDSNNNLHLSWEPVNEDTVPGLRLEQEYLDHLYDNLKFRTFAQIEAESQKKIKGIRRGLFFVFIWLVVIPTMIGLLELYSNWLSVVAFLYSFYQGIKEWLKLRGKWPKSKRDEEREQEERLKDHYYYHCRMNPEAFERLKRENFEKMAKAEIAKEAESLKKNKH